MREILFRGKTKDKEKWVYGAYIKDESPDSDGDILIVDQTKYYVFKQNWLETECVDIVIPETVGQYTGLIDKNGKKIFEGDILSFEDSMGNSEYCVVEYGNFNCNFCDGVYGWFFKDGDIRFYKSYKIVGNVYDNPELLKEV